MSAEEQPLEPGMGRCEVTGKVVPEDELIELHGKRVCAEGKAELLQRLQSGERLPGELERPSFGYRLLALIVDGIVLAPFSVGLVFLLAGGAAFQGDFEGVQFAYMASLILAHLIGILYFTLMHGRFGQTLGKMVCKMKVVKSDGTPLTMDKACIRAIMYYGPQLLAPLALAVVSAEVFGIINMVAGLYIYAQLIVLLVDKAQNRAIHDRVAATRVVMVD